MLKKKQPNETKKARIGKDRTPQMYASPNDAHPRGISRRPVPTINTPTMARVSRHTKQKNATERDLKKTCPVFTVNLTKQKYPINAVTTKAVIKPGEKIGSVGSHQSFKKLNIKTPHGIVSRVVVALE